MQAQFAGLSSTPLVPPIHPAVTGMSASHVMVSESGTPSHVSSPAASPATSEPPLVGVTKLALTRSRKPAVPFEFMTGT